MPAGTEHLHKKPFIYMKNYIAILTLLSYCLTVSAQGATPEASDTSTSFEALGPIDMRLPREPAITLPYTKVIPAEETFINVSLLCECPPGDTRNLCGLVIVFYIPMTWLYPGDRAVLTPKGCSWTLTTKQGKSKMIGCYEGEQKEFRPYIVRCVP